MAVEPRPVKKLVKASKTSQPIVLCYGLEYFEPCLLAEVSNIEKFKPCVVEETFESKYHEMATKQSVHIMHCPLSILKPRKKIPYEEVYIRPLIRLYPEQQQNQPPSKRLRAKTEKPVSKFDTLQVPRPEITKLQSPETTKSKIKFSPSTALCTPAKPSYSSYQPQYQYRAAYGASRARSEFRDRRAYVSLYY